MCFKKLHQFINYWVRTAIVTVIFLGHVSVGFTAEIEEIIVTAQKREQSLSEVPIAVSAFSGDDLSARHYTSLLDFTGAIPNVTTSLYGGSVRLNIRGVGQPQLIMGSDAGTALHSNGVFLSRSYDGVSQFMDIERVEILRGPQGTLYGRNATGGSVNIITNKPKDEFEGSVKLGYGNYDEFTLEGMISGPITDSFLGRVVVSKYDRDGYSLNLFDGKHYDDSDTFSARATFVLDVTDNLQITVVGSYHEENDGNHAIHTLGQGVPGQLFTGVTVGGSTIPFDAAGNAINPRLLSIDSIPTNDRELGGVSVEIDWDISDTLMAKSITAYRASEYRWTGDFDGTDAPFPSNEPAFSYVQTEKSRQISQELQLLGQTDRLNWILGLYYLNEDNGPIGFDFGFFPIAFGFTFGLKSESDTTTDAYAAFGQATYEIIDRLNLTVGLRYNYEKRTISEQWTSGGFVLPAGPFTVPCFDLPGLVCINNQSKSFDAVTPKFGIDYHWTDEIMTYATVSRGFKSGGFGASDLLPAFNPEKIWAYEAGIKMLDAEGRWSLNLSGFYYDYKDLQINQVIDGFTSTSNAASSTVGGFELEGKILLFEGLTVTDAFAYLDAQYKEFNIADPAFPALGIQDLSGNQLQHAPNFSNNLLLRYDTPVLGDKLLSLLFEWNWRDKTYHTEFNTATAQQSAVSTLNASVRLTADESKGWYVEGWGKNLTDELIVSQGFISSGVLGRPRNSDLSPPRTYGITVGYEF